jgi:hypothetical protein
MRWSIGGVPGGGGPMFPYLSTKMYMRAGASRTGVGSRDEVYVKETEDWQAFRAGLIRARRVMIQSVGMKTLPED